MTHHEKAPDRGGHETPHCQLGLAKIAVQGGVIANQLVQPDTTWKCSAAVPEGTCPYTALYDGTNVMRIDKDGAPVAGCHFAPAVRSDASYIDEMLKYFD